MERIVFIKETEAAACPGFALKLLGDALSEINGEQLSSYEAEEVLSAIYECLTKIRKFWSIEYPGPLEYLLKERVQNTRDFERYVCDFLNKFIRFSDNRKIEYYVFKTLYASLELNLQQECLFYYHLESITDEDLIFISDKCKNFGFAANFIKKTGLESRFYHEIDLENLRSSDWQCSVCLSTAEEKNSLDFAVLDCCVHTFCTDCAEELFLGKTDLENR